MGEAAVFYPNSSRSLSLTDCVKKVFTNVDDPLRRNLEIIIELRNTSTHYVTDEYEIFYGPILQYCVEKYDEKLRIFHGIEISDKIPENYLALSVRRGALDLSTIRARYPKQIVERMLALGTGVATEGIVGAAPYSTELRLTKKKDADFSIRVASDSDTAATILHILTDPMNKYKYRTKTAIRFIKGKLSKEGILINVSGEKKEFNEATTSKYLRIFTK